MLEIVTNLGRFIFEASVSNGIDPNLRQIEPHLRLPGDMSVDSAHAVLLSLITTEAIRQLEFKCAIQEDIAGFPCTGECLEAQEWEADGHIVTVGTEDSSCLGKRVPPLGLGEEDAIVEYCSKSMSLRLSNIPRNLDLSLHFIIAENPNPEPVECSTWFAVDQQHEELLPRACVL